MCGDDLRESLSRRRVVLGTGVGLAASLSGCSGLLGGSTTTDGGTPTTDGSERSPTTETRTETATETPTNETDQPATLDEYVGQKLGDVPGFDGTLLDRRGEDSVTVEVGAEPNNHFSFAPLAIHVDPGTTVTWVWSGEGGAHNVVHDRCEPRFHSELTSQEDHTYD